MIRLSAYILPLLFLISCKTYQSPEIEDVLIDYSDDLKHLMIIHDIDSVIWILKSKPTYRYEFKQNDTVYRLYREEGYTIFSGRTWDSIAQVSVYDSIGLPQYIDNRYYKDSIKISWIKHENHILKIENNSSKMLDSTFFIFDSGRIVNRLEKKGRYDWEYASYSYDSSGSLTSVMDTMIYHLNHHYHSYEKTYYWKDTILKQVNETFIPGTKRLTYFDSVGFPNLATEIYENGDTVTFEIRKL